MHRVREARLQHGRLDRQGIGLLLSCTKQGLRSTWRRCQRSTSYDHRSTSGSRNLYSHGHGRSAFEFTPTHPCTFYGAQDRLPDAITEHRTINQAHRENPPGAQDRFALQNARECRENYVIARKVMTNGITARHAPNGNEASKNKSTIGVTATRMIWKNQMLGKLNQPSAR